MIGMAESNNNTEVRASQTAPPAASSKPVSSGRGGVIFAVLLSLIALGGTAYVGYRLELQVTPQSVSDREQLAAVATDLKGLQEAESVRAEMRDSEAENLKSQLDSQAAELRELETRVAQSNADFTEKIDALIESTSLLYQNLDQRSADWRLEDIALLLLIGAKQLQLTGNAQAVLPIWQVAIERLKQKPDPQLLVVRTQLDDEIELLKNMRAIDVGAISARLLQLIHTIDQLPIRTRLSDPPAEVSDGDVEQSELSDGTSVSGTLDAVWSDLKSLVRVQKIRDPSTLPLNPNLRNYFAEHLKVSLFAAQTAAIRGQSHVYQSNLEYVEGALETFFDVEAPAVVDFSAALADLSQIPVVAKTPEISGSYKLLQEILDRPVQE